MKTQETLSLEDEIHALEKLCLDRIGIPREEHPKWAFGTSLFRVLLPGAGCGWTLAIGLMVRPKVVFTGATITEVFKMAKESFRDLDPK